MRSLINKVNLMSNETHYKDPPGFVYNDIQVDLDILPAQIKSFVSDTIEKANKHNIAVNLYDSRLISECNGYFVEDGETAELSVACGQPAENWIRVFIHESSHMDQFLEESTLWNNLTVGTDGTDPGHLLELWRRHCIELTDRQLWDYICRIRTNELDCEIRSANKIKKYDLPIDVDEYIKKANSYIWFYTVIGLTREWYKENKEPYNLQELWTQLPAHFDNDYGMIPPHVYDMFLSLVE